MTAGLFLMFAFHIGILADSLTERNLRFGKFNFDFIAFFQLVYHDIKMLVAHTVEKCLPVGGIILHAESLILACHSGKRLGNLILVAFLHSLISLAGIRRGDYSFGIENRSVLGCKAVSCLHAVQLRDRADISGVKLGNLVRFGSFQYIEFIQALLVSLLHVQQSVVGLDNAGGNLDQ